MAIRPTCASVQYWSAVVYKAEVVVKFSVAIQNYPDLIYLSSQAKTVTVFSIHGCCIWCKPNHCTQLCPFVS